MKVFVCLLFESHQFNYQLFRWELVNLQTDLGEILSSMFKGQFDKKSKDSVN